MANLQESGQENEKPRISWSGICWKGCKRTGVIILEGGVILALLLALFLGVVAWRLTSGPVNIDFVKETIIEALDTPGTAIYPRVENIVLYWPDLRGPLLLGMRGAELLDGEDKVFLSVKEISMSFSRSQLLLGRIKPKAIILEKPSLHIFRDENGVVDMSFAGNAAPRPEHAQADQQENMTTRILEIVAKPGTEDDSDLPLSHLEGFSVRDASLIFEDNKTGITWFLPDFDSAFFSTDSGMNVDLHMALHTDEDGESHVNATAKYNWKTKDIDFAASIEALKSRIVAEKLPSLQVLDDFDMTLDAKLNGRLGADFLPQYMNVEVRSQNGTFLIEKYSSHAKTYQDIHMKAQYSAGNRTLALEEIVVQIDDVALQVEGAITHDEAFEKLSGPIKAEIENLPHVKLAELWPEFLVGDNSHTWIVERQSDGILKDLEGRFDLEGHWSEDAGWAFDANDLEAEFSFEGMSVDYSSPMIPVTNASGEGYFDNDRELLAVRVDKASLADMTIKRADLEFRNIIQKGKGIANISMDVFGPLGTLFEALRREPIGLDDEIPFTPDEVKGTADIKLNLEFPTIDGMKKEQVKIDGSGTVDEAYLPNLVRGLPVAGGPFQVNVNNEFYTAKGKGLLADRDISFEWKEYLNSEGKAFRNQATASLVIDPNLRDYFGADLSDFLEGSVPAKLSFTQFRDKSAKASLEGDLKNARVFIDALGYEKKRGDAAFVSLKAAIDDGNLTQIKDLNVRGPDLNIQNAEVDFVQDGVATSVQKASMPSMAVGKTQVRMNIDYDDSGRMNISAAGPVFDLRPFLGGRDEREDRSEVRDPLRFILETEQGITAGGEKIRDVTLYVEMDRYNRFDRLEMDAKSGTGDVYLRFKPGAEGTRTFRLEADDAGAALRAFDVYPNVVGGMLIIDGASNGEGWAGDVLRDISGEAQLSDFKVVNAPGLARLLGALSVPGLIELLNNDGIAFTRLEAGYGWVYRPEGGLLTIKDGRTSGNSLGLTFKGEFDSAEMTMDLSGTIVPLSAVNKMLSSIPLIGTILSGGSDSVFAATYTMKGETENPETVVNPLAALTPGILRRILFE